MVSAGHSNNPPHSGVTELRGAPPAKNFLDKYGIDYSESHRHELWHVLIFQIAIHRRAMSLKDIDRIVLENAASTKTASYKDTFLSHSSKDAEFLPAVHGTPGSCVTVEIPTTTGHSLLCSLARSRYLIAEEVTEIHHMHDYIPGHVTVAAVGLSRASLNQTGGHPTRSLTHHYYTLWCNSMAISKRRQADKFPPQPSVEARPLIDAVEAAALTRLFKVFANETRLRLLHALVRMEEMCVTDLAEVVEMKPQAVSNQLQRLVDRGMLGSRRDGINIYYRVVDPCVAVLLERGFCLIECCPDES